MQRYFIEGEIPENRIVAITGDDAKHIAKVMRQEAGDEILIVVDNAAYLAEIISLDQTVKVLLKDEIKAETELPIQVTIACGLPKGDKLELIVQKSTELGMSGLIPFAAERSIVKWDAVKSDKKVLRLQKIAKEAAEQSHRVQIPKIYSPCSFKDLLKAAESYDAVVVAYEEEARETHRIRFAETVKSLYDKSSILMVFGPEGGFSQLEAEQLRSLGAVFTSLGPRILRAETAPLYALSAISYEFE
ncbi:MAG TPA: 16S rRNA (uracil(1498)-N(3))-methyltransferase [Planococcus sp. (in: firmicutes)]|nr:16S rRNA (uracil(1498)-N(3))-methyltransferase [Planococcus sp. (in: firmicutes)]